jgi:hypothetical protein
MSIRVMTAVWEHADVSGGELVVLLAMADWCDDDGHKCFPTQERLARKARMTDRGVRKCLSNLVEKGYLRREGRLGGGPVEWSVHATANATPEQSSDRNPSAGQTGTPVPTDTSGEPSREESVDSSPSKPGESSNGNGIISPGPGPIALCRRLGELIVCNDPKAKPPTYSKRWLDAARLLVDSDGRHFEEALAVLEWSQADEFWKTNILSMPTFRKQYPRLRMRWIQERQPSAAAALVSTAELIGAYEQPRSRTGIR